MNILYLTNHLNIGGITSYVLTLASGLKKRGHHIYVASSGGELLPKFIQEGVVYFPIPIKTKSEISPKILFSLFKLSNVIRKNNIEILHSNSRTTQVLGCLLSGLSKVRHISTCHGFFKRRLSRRLFPCWGSEVIAISEAVKEHLVKDFRVQEERVRVIRHGIEVNKYGVRSTEYRAKTKEKIGLGNGPVVGIVARLSDVKGHVYLIKAVSLVLEKIPDAQLLIVGEGKMKNELMDLCRQLKITKSVFFIPRVYDSSEVLAIMDVFVLPSLKEGLGLSLMEAMAAGVAVIGSDVGGISDLIRNGFNGLLVKSTDSKGLACAILELLLDPQKRESLGKNARIFMAKDFSLEKMILQTEMAYRESLK